MASPFSTTKALKESLVSETAPINTETPFQQNLSHWIKHPNPTKTLALALFLQDADSIAVKKGTLPDEYSAMYGSSTLLRTAEYILDSVVKLVQPRPKVAHVEYVLLDDMALRGQAYAHFATYIGDKANWRETDDFYKRRVWRAVPLWVLNEKARACCNEEVGTPYSLTQYCTSTQVMQRFSGLWGSDKPKTSAHCATLTARLIERSCGISLNQPPAAFSPSSLYNALTPSDVSLRYAHNYKAAPTEVDMEYADTPRFEQMTDAALINMTPIERKVAFSKLVEGCQGDVNSQTLLASQVFRLLSCAMPTTEVADPSTLTEAIVPATE